MPEKSQLLQAFEWYIQQNLSAENNSSSLQEKITSLVVQIQAWYDNDANLSSRKKSDANWIIEDMNLRYQTYIQTLEWCVWTITNDPQVLDLIQINTLSVDEILGIKEKNQT